MSTTGVISVVREMLLLTLTLASPFLAAAVASSFIVGLIQAATRINDLTLSFVPRFIAVLVVAYFGATWANALMAAYLHRAANAMRGFNG